MLSRRIAILSITSLVLLLSVQAAEPVNFSDLPQDHFAYPSVKTLSSMGILSGHPDGSFRPNQTITRAEAAKIVTNIAIETGKIDDIAHVLGGPAFTDTPTHQWYYFYVRLASKHGLITGYQSTSGAPTGTFNPAGLLTRAEAAKLLFLASYYPETNTLPIPFSDVDPDAWYATYVTSAYNLSMIDGYTAPTGSLSGLFGPEDPITRGAFAKMAAASLSPKDRVPYNPQECHTIAIASSGTLLPESSTGVTLAETCTPKPPRVILSCSYSPELPHCDLAKQRKASPFKFLFRYPFKNTAVELVEGFSSYVGNLDDQVGVPHGGIDYALRATTGFTPFEVYTMHAGYIAQGNSPSWGKYVIIFYPEEKSGKHYATLYSHLTNVPSNLPWYFVGGNYRQYPFWDTGSYVGEASTTGDTKNNPQLHMEIHEYDKDFNRTKRDLYNIYSTIDSGKYPTVGEIFSYDTHHFISNLPEIQ